MILYISNLLGFVINVYQTFLDFQNVTSVTDIKTYLFYYRSIIIIIIINNKNLPVLRIRYDSVD